MPRGLGGGGGVSMFLYFALTVLPGYLDPAMKPYDYCTGQSYRSVSHIPLTSPLHRAAHTVRVPE